MNKEQFRQFIGEIVKEAKRIKDMHTSEFEAPVNYACIFCQSEAELHEFQMHAEDLGKIIEQTSSGPLFQLIPSIDTVSGPLQLLKVRKPDASRPERGDADFTVSSYVSFKQKYLGQPGFSLIQKDDFEMIELFFPGDRIRAYFSNPPLDEQLGIVPNSR